MDIKEAIDVIGAMKDYMPCEAVEIYALDTAIEALENQLSDKWTAMIEGLPREQGWYLVTRECGKVDTGHWFLNEGWREGYNSKVIAWRQLPSPYPSPYRKI